MARLRWDRLDIIDGVPETLAELRRRHDLLLLTKGDREEQVRRRLEVVALPENDPRILRVKGFRELRALFSATAGSDPERKRNNTATAAVRGLTPIG
jgi:hypothetical protein